MQTCHTGCEHQKSFSAIWVCMPNRAWWRHSWGNEEGKVGRGGGCAECIKGLHPGEVTSKTSSLMIRGIRMQISLMVFRPTVISSGCARSCTNWLHKCRMTGCSQSGGTRSWHACETHWQSVMLILRCRCVCSPMICCQQGGCDRQQNCKQSEQKQICRSVVIVTGSLSALESHSACC